MRKFFGTILGVFLLLGFANAQKFDLGIKGGYLYSDMDVKDFKGFKSKGKSGYLVGAFARIGGDKWFFQPELQYRARTADFEFIDAAKGNVEVDFKTLDVPLQLGINLLDLSIVKLSVHTGPVVSFKLSDETTPKNLVKDFNIKDYKDYKSMIWAGQIGVSADISRFVVDITYEKGFSDIAEKGAGKNDLFMVSLGIKIL